MRRHEVPEKGGTKRGQKISCSVFVDGALFPGAHLDHFVFPLPLPPPTSTSPPQAHFFVSHKSAPLVVVVLVKVITIIIVVNTLPTTTTPLAASSSSGSTRVGRRGGRRRVVPQDAPAAEEDGLELAVPAPPHAQGDAEGAGGGHGEPPHGVARQGAGVEGGEEEVEEVDREGEVGDEFTSGDEDDDGDGPVMICQYVSSTKGRKEYLRRRKQLTCRALHRGPRQRP